jgi:predicted dehydrogenase
VEAKLKVGIVGCGILGSNHARFFARNPNTTVAALADPLPGRAERLASPLGAQAFADAREMIQRTKPDLVVVATPDPFHRDPVVFAAEAKVPFIITEKPMATSVADAEAMLGAAKASGSRLWVHLPTRTAPEEIASRYVVQQGLLGDPIWGDLTCDDNISVPTSMWHERSREWASQSSVAQFLFSHLVDRMRWMFEPAEVSRVDAILIRRVLDYTPDLFDARLYWTNGLVLRLKSEWIRHMESLVDVHFYLSGSRGGITQHRAGFATEGGWQATLDQGTSTADLEMHQQALLEMGVISRAIVRRPHPDVEGAGPRPSLEVSAKFLPLFGGDAPAEMRDHIVQAIVDGVEVPATWKGGGRLPTGDDGLEQTRVVCAIEESARTGKPVSLR